MKFFTLLFSLLLTSTFSFLNAQHQCGATNLANSLSNARVAVTGQNIDVVYHRMLWRVNPDTTFSPANATASAIRGFATIYFKTKVANVSSINFDFIKASYNNANTIVKYHGTTVTHSFPSTGNVDIINIPITNIPTIGTLDSVTINYGGRAPAINGEAYGLQKTGTAGSTAYYWTLAESYEDRNFFPCKHDMTDKIDSMLITISCPSVHIGVSNGKLVSEVTNGASKEYTYKSTYPIASYLVAMSVGRFNKYSRTPVDINGTSVPITYYRRTALSAANLIAADTCKSMMKVLSNLFGDYPYKNDGYGMMEFGFGGGMEHQTMSSMSSTEFTSYGIIAHELAHQWFGDKITFSTWNDLWISEGFTNYSETLPAEFDNNAATNAVTMRNALKTGAIASTSPVYISDATTSNTIWTMANNDAIYKRGGMVVSMLRKLLGDTKFFQACRNMLNSPAHAYRSISTAEVKGFFEAESGLNLTEFFNDWIYASGTPKYTVGWGKSGNRIAIELNQNVSAGATVTHFSMPVVLKFANAAGTKDTTVVIFDDNNVASNAGNRTTNQLVYNLSFTPATVTLDPNSEMLVSLVQAGGSIISQTVVVNTTIENLYGVNKNTYNEVVLDIQKNSNLKDVIIEKGYSTDNFIEIGKINTISETSTSQKYSYKDFSPYQPATYYRIKFIQFDGTITYSNVVKINGSKFEKIKVLGNPVQNNNLQFQLNSNTLVNAAKVVIVDMNGKVVMSDVLRYNGISNYNVATLSKGQYVVTIIDRTNTLIATSTFIK